METKKAIRARILKKRESISADRRRDCSQKILKQLILHPWFRQAQEVCTYIGSGSEVETKELCRLSLNQGKKVYCPKVLEKGRMEFYRIWAFEELEEGYRGILEPPITKKPDLTQKTLMIVPLAGFDRKGNRLGYGGGFYDRYLAKWPEVKRIALAFDEQRVEEEIPVEAFDIPMKSILTPSGFYPIEEGEQKGEKLC